MMRMKGVIGMRTAGLIVFVTVVCAQGGWAQGSRPKEPSVPVTASAPVSATAGVASAVGADSATVYKTGTERKGPKVRYKKGTGGMDWGQAEFLDERGRIVKVLKNHGSGSGKGFAMIIHGEHQERYVGVLESTPAVRGSWATFHYYDVRGRELWSARMCCPLGWITDRHVQVSDDGSVVLIFDKPEGALCSDPVLDQVEERAPKGCASLRVMSAKGEELLRVTDRMGEAFVSPNGKYVLYYLDGHFKKGVLFHVASRKLEELPVIDGAILESEIGDDGVLRYLEKAPGHTYRVMARYTPGKGLERLDR